LALAALALVVFSAYDSYPVRPVELGKLDADFYYYYYYWSHFVKGSFGQKGGLSHMISPQKAGKECQFFVGLACRLCTAERRCRSEAESRSWQGEAMRVIDGVFAA